MNALATHGPGTGLYLEVKSLATDYNSFKEIRCSYMQVQTPEGRAERILVHECVVNLKGIEGID